MIVGYIPYSTTKHIVGFEDIEKSCFPLTVEVDFITANGWAYITVAEMKRVGWENCIHLPHLILDIRAGEIDIDGRVYGDNVNEN